MKALVGALNQEKAPGGRENIIIIIIIILLASRGLLRDHGTSDGPSFQALVQRTLLCTSLSAP